jgi:hypothetical protein
VLGDASDFHRTAGTSALTGLLSTAGLLRRHTGSATTAQLVTADNTRELIAQLRRLAPELSGVYLVHTDPVPSARRKPHSKEPSQRSPNSRPLWSRAARLSTRSRICAPTSPAHALWPREPRPAKSYLSCPTRP